MQLVGNMHPHLVDRSQRTIARKLAEQAAAREMERHYSKDQILEAYLNQISFGHGWLGVEAASRHYFGKNASRLTLDEAAMLAALPKGPAIYDPVRHPEEAIKRRNLVLSLMLDQGYITRAEADSAKAKPLVTVPDGGVSAPSGYFVDAVRAAAERVGINLMSGGYRVYTTLDPALQRAAVEALRIGAQELESQPGYAHLKFAARRAGQTGYLQGAIVAIDPFAGQVRALVGGRDYALAPFNRAVTARRQPGSAFKPFVYAAAIADSVPAGTFVADTAISLTLPNGDVYAPTNSDREFLGSMTMREALVKSRNSVAVQLGQLTGMDTVVALARRMGIESAIAPVPASAIGASAVSPLELVAAYGAFANLGMAVEPRMILRIEDSRGRTVFAAREAASVLVLDPRVAFIVRDMLREAAQRGTGAGARAMVPARIPIAGKTGTTNDNADVWFVGMTPEIVAGVWLGFDTPKPIASGVFGGTLAAPIWGRMVASWYSGREAGQFTVPGGVLTFDMDRATGALADSLTPPERRYPEYFLPGTEPEAVRANPLRLFRLGPIGGY
jgi:penicillin-binding protein 1A